MIKFFLVFFCFFFILSSFAWAVTSDNEQNLSKKPEVQNIELQILNKKIKQLNSSGCVTNLWVILRTRPILPKIFPSVTHDTAA